MRAFKNMNRISDALKKSIPEFKENAVFELLDVYEDPNTHERLFGATRTIQGKDLIRDGDEFVQIGVPDVIENGEVKTCKFFVLGGKPDERVTARFELSPGKIEDVEWYEFFCLSNINASNPNADKSTKKVIKLVNEVADAKEYNEKMDILLEALQQLKNMNYEKMQIFAASKNMNQNVKKEILYKNLREFVMKHPQEFVDAINDDNTMLKAELKIARDKGVIGVDVVKNDVIWAESGRLITTLDRNDQDWLEALAVFINKSTNGEDIMNQIRKSSANKKKRAEVN